MQPDEMIGKLTEARRLLREVRDGTDLPQIQSILGHADQNLHWALWTLGEVDGLRPELSEEH